MKDLIKSNVKRGPESWIKETAEWLFRNNPKTVYNRGIDLETILSNVKHHRKNYFLRNPTVSEYVIKMALEGSQLCKDFKKELEL
jgi:hypothetical protein